MRQFAASMGRMEKADAIDAHMIAWFAAVKNSCRCVFRRPGLQQLRALVTPPRQLTEIRTAQRNQQGLINESDSR